MWVRPARRAGQGDPAAPMCPRAGLRNRVNEHGEARLRPALSLPVPEPAGWATCGAFSEPRAAQAEAAGAEEEHRLRGFLKI